jgi:hypothetical protein
VEMWAGRLSMNPVQLWTVSALTRLVAHARSGINSARKTGRVIVRLLEAVKGTR